MNNSFKKVATVVMSIVVATNLFALDITDSSEKKNEVTLQEVATVLSDYMTKADAQEKVFLDLRKEVEELKQSILHLTRASLASKTGEHLLPIEPKNTAITPVLAIKSADLNVTATTTTPAFVAK